MAKWYRSIRVVGSNEPLGTWLTRHGLPVLTGMVGGWVGGSSVWTWNGRLDAWQRSG